MIVTVSIQEPRALSFTVDMSREDFVNLMLPVEQKVQAKLPEAKLKSPSSTAGGTCQICGKPTGRKNRTTCLDKKCLAERNRRHQEIHRTKSYPMPGQPILGPGSPF